MHGKWGALVYTDLFCGPGRSKIDNKRIIDAPPLIVLSSEFSFDKYVFCDVSSEKIDALRKRVISLFPSKSVSILNGDANKIAVEILAEMPQHRPGYKVLGLTFVDPYKIDNLKFETMRTLSEKFMDFLVLLPTDMDAQRNVGVYEKPENKRVEEFLGNSNWRETWATAKARGEHFGIFVANEFTRSMEHLGYKNPGLENMKLVRSVDKNLPLYRLALYSRHALGKKFWKDAVRYTDPQAGFLDF
jgi:three-Cys-motif partner protein